MSKFTILVDTSYDLPQEYIDENELKIVSIPFHLNGVTHENGRWQEISDVDFYKALSEGGVAGTTLTNPETFIQIFTEYAKNDEELLVVLLSSGLSGTAQNALIALNEVKETYPDCKIYPVDGLNAAGGTGLITVLAVNKRAEGLSAEETANWLNEKKHSCFAVFTVDDLMYLHRGGRLSKLQAVAGSIIGVKPLLNVHPDGTLKLKDKARGRKAALETLAGQLIRSVNPGTKLDTVIISHSNCLADAEKVAELVRESVEVKEFILVMMGPVIGAHVGPGCIAMFFEADMNREEYEEKFYSKK
ncbi:MAG: DegV family protein [Oscillospiraceae bacterium]|jgi:DegV family protein with EDD domain|nr:DegV family protein [Oscillospiraceae bacterium]